MFSMRGCANCRGNSKAPAARQGARQSCSPGPSWRSVQGVRGRPAMTANECTSRLIRTRHSCQSSNGMPSERGCATCWAGLPASRPWEGCKTVLRLGAQVDAWAGMPGTTHHDGKRAQAEFDLNPHGRRTSCRMPSKTGRVIFSTGEVASRSGSALARRGKVQDGLAARSLSRCCSTADAVH